MTQGPKNADEFKTLAWRAAHSAAMHSDYASGRGLAELLISMDARLRELEAALAALRAKG